VSRYDSGAEHRDTNIFFCFQIRGSIPLFWTQKPNLRYKPKPALTTGNHAEALTKHFQDMGLRYTRVVCINLVSFWDTNKIIFKIFNWSASISLWPA